MSSDDYNPSREELFEHEERARQSLRVPCKYCGAQRNEPCTNKHNGKPAHKFIAHPIRITDNESDEVPFC
jgi:hypothetical protein